MLKIVLLALLLAGCDGTNEQIATCVNTCKSINASMSYWSGQGHGRYLCVCNRYYNIGPDGNNVTEINQ